MRYYALEAVVIAAAAMVVLTMAAFAIGWLSRRLRRC